MWIMPLVYMVVGTFALEFLRYAGDQFTGAHETAVLAEQMKKDAVTKLLYTISSEEAWKQEQVRRMPKPGNYRAQQSLVESGAHPAIAPLAELYERGPETGGSLSDQVNARIGRSRSDMKVALDRPPGLVSALSE